MHNMQWFLIFIQKYFANSIVFKNFAPELFRGN